MTIRPMEAEFYADNRTDRHDKANSLLSQFYESAWKWITGIASFDIWRFGGLEEPSASVVIL
jgi:hypothetical protein